MPELPDVAAFKSYLDATSLHQRVERSTCTDERFVKDVSRQALERRLKGAELVASKRYGKWLFAPLSEGGCFVMHFGMSGSLRDGKDEGELPKHARFVLHFESGRRLALISQRMIGRASFCDEISSFVEDEQLGPDALEGRLEDEVLGAEAFAGLFEKRRGSLKSALMDQSLIAGIGNVYSDEIAFRARLHPATSVAILGRDELLGLHETMRAVLAEASEAITREGSPPSTWLVHHRQEGERCPRCGAELESARINGRRAWFCVEEQPERC